MAMETVTLAARVVSTRVGFGCGGLMRVASRKDRQAVLAAACNQGITHFDVARMYGLGAAEKEVGRFLRGMRDSVVIATKFGIETKGISARLAGLQGPARSLLARSPRLRALAQSERGAFERPRRYDGDAARRSLETSLRALNTDYIDVFFVHDPKIGDVVDVPDICAYLEKARDNGSIRAWGVAGEPEPCVEIGRAMSEPAILQVRDDIFGRTLGAGEEPGRVITFGVLSRALGRISEYLEESPQRRAQWAQATGLDCTRDDTVASLLIQDALQVNRNGVVLVSTRQPGRLQRLDALVAAAREVTVELGAFREQVNSIGRSDRAWDL